MGIVEALRHLAGQTGARKILINAASLSTAHRMRLVNVAEVLTWDLSGEDKSADIQGWEAGIEVMDADTIVALPSLDAAGILPEENFWEALKSIHEKVSLVVVAAVEWTLYVMPLPGDRRPENRLQYTWTLEKWKLGCKNHALPLLWSGILTANTEDGNLPRFMAILPGVTSRLQEKNLEAEPWNLQLDLYPEISDENIKSRVCIVTNEWDEHIGNGETGAAYTSLAIYLSKTGHQVTILLPVYHNAISQDVLSKKITEYAVIGIEIVSLPLQQYDYGQNIQDSFHIYQWLKVRERSSERFDVIHFPESRGLGYHATLAKSQRLAFLSTTLVVGLHAPSSFMREANLTMPISHQDFAHDRMEEMSVALADVLISPSRYLLDWVDQMGWKLPERVFVHPHIAIAAIQEKPTLLPKQFTEIVFFGRLEMRKGLTVFCEALSELRQAPELAGIKITFLGDPTHLSGRKIVEKIESTEYIHGHTRDWPWPIELLTKYDQAATLEVLTRPGVLAVIPSLMENSSNVILECLGRKIPFLASRSGGIGELLEPSVLATHTFPLTDPERPWVTSAKLLAAALCKRLSLPALPPPKFAFSPETVLREWSHWHQRVARHYHAGASVEVISNYPKVSVCMATFNRVDMLESAISSLEAQDYSNFEVIIVNDGSTLPEAQEYHRRLEPRLATRGWTLLHQENAFMGTARNTAAAHASGEFILFMDDDNVALPHEISTYVRAMENSDADALTCGLWHFTTTPHPHEAEMELFWFPMPAVPAIGMVDNCFGDANFLIRRSVFEKMGGFSTEYGATWEDWEFLAKLTIQGGKVYTVPEVLFQYRIMENSVSRTTKEFHNQRLMLTPFKAAMPPIFRDLPVFALNTHEQNNILQSKINLYKNAQIAQKRTIKELHSELKKVRKQLLKLKQQINKPGRWQKWKNSLRKRGFLPKQ